MLAQLQTVPAEFLKNFAILALALLAAGLGLATYLSRNKSRRIVVDEQPVQTVINGQVNTVSTDKFATRDFVAERNAELDRRLSGHDADIRKIYDELKQDRAASEIHASQRSSAIYQEIGIVRKDLGEKLDAQTREFHQCIRDLPTQIIVMLRNTGVIK